MKAKKTEEEKEILKLILAASEEFLQPAASNPDYQKIADTILHISGAKYAVFDLYDENGQNFTSIAISAPDKIIKRASSLLGFKLSGKKWKSDHFRAEKTLSRTITNFASLSELEEDVIPKPVASILQSTFKTGEVVFVKIEKESLIIGYFTLIMPEGTSLKNDDYVKLYSRLVGLLMVRIRSEEALRKSGEKFSKTFHAGSVLMAISTVDEGRFIDVNEMFLKTLGFKREEVIGRKSSDLKIFVKQQQREENKKIFQQKGRISATEMLVRGRDGVVHTGIFTADPIDIEGTDCWLTTLTDITDRKKAEEEFRLERDRLSDIVEGTNVGTWEWNVQAGTIKFDVLSAGFLGYTLDELSPISIEAWEKFVHPDDLEEANKQLSKVFAREKDYFDIESRLKHKNGTWIWEHDRGKVTSWTPDGKPLFMSGMYIDISERKKTEEALIFSENRFKTIFSQAPLGIALIDSLTGRMYSVNPMYAKIAGRTMEEMDNIDWMSITHPDDIQKDLDNMALLNAGKINGFQMEKRYLHKDGSCIWINMTVAPVFTEDRAHPRHLAMIEDITERKKAEEEIVHLSFHDQLTGLYNRRFFEEELKRLDTERNFPLSIIVGDLNGLKITNDTFGHYEGDKILIKASDVLKRVCRSGDILARWGGDEFVVLLPNTSISGAEDIMGRIRSVCSKTGSQKIPISLSLGAATKEMAGHDIQAVLLDAESNMYKNKIVEKENLINSIIFSFGQTLYEKSDETEEHISNIRDLSARLGKSAKLSESQLDELLLLASLHDIGKVVIPERILFKKGKLTEKEWSVVKRHPEIGFNIAQSSPQISHIAKSILYCHENWDGSGYPIGISGESIPLISRIILIADAYDVMTSGRAYKPAVSREDAITELKSCSGTQFDPELVDKFLKILE